MARSCKNLIVAKKNSEEIKYSGPTHFLNDVQIKSMLYDKETFNLRTPSIVLQEKDQSILLVGWSRPLWTAHAILKCENVNYVNASLVSELMVPEIVNNSTM